MILYQYPGGDGLVSISPPCVKVQLALRRLGIEYRVMNLRSSRGVGRVSATGRLPVLEVDGARIPDSIAILDELERRSPGGALGPQEPEARVRDRLWEHFATDSMYWVGFWLRWVDAEVGERFFQAAFGRMPWPARVAVSSFVVPSQRRRIRLVGHGGKTPTRIRSEFATAIDMFETGLSGGPFLEGRDRPGRGDLACAAILSQAGYRDTMPDQMARIRGSGAVYRHLVDVHEACDMELPRWLRRDGV